MSSSLVELLRIANPPANPIHTGNNADLSNIEKQIGSELPPDYVELVRNYGDSLWYGHVNILSPFKPDEYSLWGWHCKNIQQLTTLFNDPYLLTDAKHCVYPERGGVLLCGGDIFGEHIAWVTEGSPCDWPIVYFSYNCFSYDRYEMNITTFLLKLVKGEIKPNCFPNDIRGKYGNQSIVSRAEFS